jgi:hypothetical protein
MKHFARKQAEPIILGGTSQNWNRPNNTASTETQKVTTTLSTKQVDVMVLVLQGEGVVDPNVSPSGQLLKENLDLPLLQCFKQSNRRKHILGDNKVHCVSTSLIDARLGGGVACLPCVDDDGVLEALLGKA